MLVKNDDDTKMEEGEYFAIETFGSTGRGRIVEGVSLVPSLSPLKHYSQLVLLRESVLTTPKKLMPHMYPFGQWCCPRF